MVVSLGSVPVPVNREQTCFQSLCVLFDISKVSKVFVFLFFFFKILFVVLFLEICGFSQKWFLIAVILKPDG